LIKKIKYFYILNSRLNRNYYAVILARTYNSRNTPCFITGHYGYVTPLLLGCFFDYFPAFLPRLLHLQAPFSAGLPKTESTFTCTSHRICCNDDYHLFFMVKWNSMKTSIFFVLIKKNQKN